jgi:hypothetical protein
VLNHWQHTLCGNQGYLTQCHRAENVLPFGPPGCLTVTVNQEALVQYPGFHSFVACPRQDSSYVTDVTHEFTMSLRRHQTSPRRPVPEAFQEHKPNCLRTPRRRCQVGVMHARCLPESTNDCIQLLVAAEQHPTTRLVFVAF